MSNSSVHVLTGYYNRVRLKEYSLCFIHAARNYKDELNILNSKLIITEGADHDHPTKMPEKTWQAIEEFIGN